MVAENVTSRLTSGRYRTPALLLVGAGFEERARAVLMMLSSRAIDGLVAVLYRPPLADNRATELLIDRYEKKHRPPKTRVIHVDCDPRQPRRFSEAMRSALMEFEHLVEGEVWVDVSGMPMHVICISIALCRARWPDRAIRIIYTEAREYFPTKNEYEGVKRGAKFRSGNELPKALTSEMDDNIIPEMFSGFAVREAPTCLILQAGYERHRSEGVVDYVNPNKLVIVYGRPVRASLHWRVLMARDLHSSLVGTRPVSEEEVETLHISQTVELLTNYYEMLFDNHNIAIAPIGGKLQTVGTYLVWEKFRDIQIVYPLPVSYLPHRSSRGVGKTFWVQLPMLRERRSIFGEVLTSA